MPLLCHPTPTSLRSPASAVDCCPNTHARIPTAYFVSTQVERAAKGARLGIWDGTFEKPGDWRKENKKGANGSSAKATAAAAPLASVPSQSAPHPKGCDIKGNINSKGERIYHVPGGQYYEATVIDGATGEKWFCSEKDAAAAGWRASSR
eukprot:1871559-Pyramimonas_sp.AAC.1